MKKRKKEKGALHGVKYNGVWRHRDGSERGIIEVSQRKIDIFVLIAPRITGDA